MEHMKFFENGPLRMDGAMGTYYSMKYNTHLVSEHANKNYPERIKEIHKEYIRAGAHIIRSNSFAINERSLNVSSIEIEELIHASVRIAKESIIEENKEGKVLLASSIGPIPIKNEVEIETIQLEYERICNAHIEASPDIILFETFHEFTYIKDIIDMIKRKNPDILIFTTFCMNKNGYTSSGLSYRTILNEINKNPNIDGGGFNCGIGSGHMLRMMKNMRTSCNKILLAIPNASYPEQFSNRMVFHKNESYFASNMQELLNIEVDIIGGCCGTSPNYIKKLGELEYSSYKNSKKKILKEEAELAVEVVQNEFYSLFDKSRKVIAVELDPPFDANDSKILECANKLKELMVDVVTIADSPMGRSRVDSVLMSIKISNEVNIPVMPHLCCRDKNLIAMRSSILGGYVNGVRNLLLVTGDPIPSDQRQSITGVFDHNSIKLMNYVSEMNREHFITEPIYFGGALNYGRGRLDKIIERMEQKMKAGASYFLTQPIYSKEDIERLRYIKESVDTKILCGIMPLVSYRNANFIKNEIAGIHVPDSIIERYHMDMTKEEGEIVAAKISSEIIEQLSEFADGYYFMLPFNRVSLMERIIIK